jgi:hypothetical protein
VAKRLSHQPLGSQPFIYERLSYEHRNYKSLGG